jgi:beta-mannosidase
MEALKQISLAEELDEIRETPSWKLHHAMRAWTAESHACVETLKLYFGNEVTVEERVAQSDWLQCEGMKAIFEEARRQWPHCSAALNWAFNEPWITAANLSIVRYPAIPKPGYFATKNALRSTMFSARIPHFDWKSGERFTAQIWLLNDSNEQVSGSVEVILRIGDKEISLLKWDNAEAEANANTEGASVCCTLPAVDTDYMTLILKADKGMSSEYKLLYEKKITRHAPKGMNM